MSSEVLVKGGSEEEWMGVTLSSSLTSSYEDLGGRNGDCGTSELSSFIVVSEGDSVEVPSSSLPQPSPAYCSKNGPSSGERHTREQEDPGVSNTKCKVVSAVTQSTLSLEGVEETCRAGRSEMLSLKGSSGLDKTAATAPALTGSAASVELSVLQREAILARNANKDLKLKVSKLTTLLDQRVVEIESYKQSISELQSKLLIMSEERKTAEHSVCHKDDTIATLKVKLAEEKTRHTQEVNQDSSKKISELEKANNELSIKNKELEEKYHRLSLENKTLFERSSILLSQVQDSETKRAVETCERQVLEGKIDLLIQELDKVRKESQEGKKNHGRAGSSSSASKRSPLIYQEAANTPETAITSKSAEHNREKFKVGSFGDIDSRWQVNIEDSCKSSQVETVSVGRGETTREEPQKQNSKPKMPGNCNPTRQNADEGVRSRRMAAANGTAGVECPMCNKKVFGSEATVALHVEQCIQLSELKERREDNIGDQP